MKIRELLQEDTTPFGIVRELNSEFKALAADFDITLVAVQGWPVVVKDGGWFGGGLGAKGGEFKDQEIISLPIESRRKGFLKALAKKLEGLMANGRTVKISAGAARGTHKEDAVTGKVFEQLSNNTIMAEPPGLVGKIHIATGQAVDKKMPVVAWFVSLPSSVADTTAVRLSMTFYKEGWQERVKRPDPDDHVLIEVGGPLDIKEARKLEKDFTAYMEKTQPTFVYNQKTGKGHSVPAKISNRPLYEELTHLLAKEFRLHIPHPLEENAGAMSIATKLLTKKTVPVDMEKVAAIIRKHIT